MDTDTNGSPRDAAIEAMLVLSTAHISPATCNAFLPSYRGPIWPKGDYGWFVYVPDDVDDAMPDDLKACLALARETGACWVMFDRDQAEMTALPIHEW